MEYPKPPKRIKTKAKKVYKPKSDQRDMFLRIWEKRPHRSELSGSYLGDIPNAWFFAHILGKGAYPQAKYDENNIMLVTQEEHWQLDQNTHLAKTDPLYAPFFAVQEMLKQKYA
jgi:hypothetical protein